MENWLSLTVVSEAGQHSWQYSVRSLWNGGWSSRDQQAVRRHVDELAIVGVPAPTTTPICFPLSNNLATTSTRIQVVGQESSGEIEYALLFNDDDLFVTVASDHTDRAFERHGIQQGKQLCPNVLAPQVWPYREVRRHWEQMVLRCWTTTQAERKLYQESSLAELLAPEDWLPILTGQGIRQSGLLFLSGTPPTIGGLLFADAYELELEDPVLGRSIRHSYQVEVLGPGRQ